MEPAAYGVIGALAGGALSGLFSLLTTRVNARTKNDELAHQREMQQLSLAVEARKEKSHRYATFLSAFWQEERYVSEMIEQLSERRTGWSDAIRRINASPKQVEAIATLNESVGWLSVLSADASVERATLALSASFDAMMEEFGTQLDCARNGGACDLSRVLATREVVRSSARELSVLLRRDLQSGPEPASIVPAPPPSS